MRCVKVSASGEELLDPGASQWGSIAQEEMKLDATPLANQPSEYIKASRDEREIGKVRKLKVHTAHNGKEIFFRLSWGDESQSVTISNIDVFPDGCGVLIPVKGGDPPIDEMGSEKAPVNAWFWRADRPEEPRNTTAKGLGTTLYSETTTIRTRSQWQEGVWTVVFARPLQVPDPKAEEGVQLAAGTTVKVGFAVWEGNNGERGGVKSFSKEWRDLEVQA
jgi:DMSO reductase family type II enzyme heme b subunit